MDVIKSFWSLPPPSYTALPTYNPLPHHYNPFTKMNQEAELIDTPVETQQSLPETPLSPQQKRDRRERIAFLVWLHIRILCWVILLLLAVYIRSTRLVSSALIGVANSSGLSAFADCYAECLRARLDLRINLGWWRPVLEGVLFIFIQVVTFICISRLQIEN